MLSWGFIVEWRKSQVTWINMFWNF